MKSTAPKKDQIDVGTKLRKYREEAGLTPQEMAEKITYSLSGIRKMERPDANPTVKSMELYLRACGRTLGELFRHNERSRRTA